MAAAVPAPYVLVSGGVPAIAGIGENDTIMQCLHWMAFTANQNTRLRNDALGSFDDIKLFDISDVDAMSKDYASRASAATGKMHWGARKLKLMKGFVHWIQDFYRISSTPDIEGLDAFTFRTALDVALRREDIRSNLKKQSKTAADAASPGPLESERKWKTWEEKFVNYCKAHIGAFGIPLSYVIREDDAPSTAATFPDFVTQTIECAPLTGDFYNADRLSVFNMLITFTTGQPSGDWISNTLKYSNGRRSMKALRDHFAGEGNATRNIADADRLKESLHYKSERAMPFETFLTQCQKMFNIYDQEGEPMADDARVRFLFQRVQHKDLQHSIEALEAQITAGSAITYTKAANHLSTKVSKLPEYIAKNRNVSGVATGGNGGDGTSSSIRNADGSINTEYISNWSSLSRADKNVVREERKRLGMSKPNGKGSPSTTSGGSKADANRMKQLVAQNKKYKRVIKAFKRKDPDSGEADAAGDGSDSDTDAGDQFGGKNSKKKKKS